VTLAGLRAGRLMLSMWVEEVRLHGGQALSQAVTRFVFRDSLLVPSVPLTLRAGGLMNIEVCESISVPLYSSLQNLEPRRGGVHFELWSGGERSGLLYREVSRALKVVLRPSTFYITARCSCTIFFWPYKTVGN
jgi:hypothetical protein